MIRPPSPAPVAADPAAALDGLRLPRDLADLGEMVVRGRRLSFEDGLRLYAHPDLLAVGRLADWVRRRRHGNTVWFNVNRHVNPTNVCLQDCAFCAFGRRGSQPETWEMSHEEVWDRVEEAVGQGATEIHVVGGLHPHYDLAWFEECFREVKRRHPGVHLKALTAVEIAWFAEQEGLTHREVLERLLAAGMDSMPGGGAEILHPEVREEICDNKCDASTWLEIHRVAHGMGIPTNATMLYGHVERDAHRVDHVLRLRELQDETGGFQTFIPLAFHPENTALEHLPGPSGRTDLRVVAVSRLLLDNVDHVKAYWIMLGLKTAQVALSFGADDLDGTVVEERIVHMAGATTPQALSVDDLRHLIEEAGFVARERDTLYNEVAPRDAGVRGS